MSESIIKVNEVTKSFGKIKAVDNVSFEIQSNNVFGMIGTNGAGKSTMLRMMAGILKPDRGQITVDGMKIYNNDIAKRNIFFISDEAYFFRNATAKEMSLYYKRIFNDFDRDMFYKYLQQFDLDKDRKINTFSKGMKKQLSLLLGICSKTKYLYCDETFDGLDPVMRQGIKGIFAGEMQERGLTPIIASHNLRELEDICDHVGLLHKGGILLSKELYDMKLNMQKVQVIFEKSEDKQIMKLGMDIIKEEKRGKLYTYIIRENRETVEKLFNDLNTVYYEIIPLSLEEIFISETEVVGYDIKHIIFG